MIESAILQTGFSVRAIPVIEDNHAGRGFNGIVSPLASVLKPQHTVHTASEFWYDTRINNNLDRRTALIVCAHELGHDQLHRELGKGNGIQEFSLYNMTSRCEYEANVFTAELTLPDDKTIQLICVGYDSEQIARSLNSDINLVALKVDNLVRSGQPFRTIDHDSRFLK